MLIKVPGLTDLERLTEIHLNAFGAQHSWSSAAIESALASERVAAIGIWIEEAWGGFALVQRVEPEAEILTFAIDPEAQNKGYGQALLGAVLQEVEGRGVTRIFLEVAADNDPALALYRGAGFTEDGRRSGYYSREGVQSVDAILMSRGIAGHTESKEA